MIQIRPLIRAGTSQVPQPQPWYTLVYTVVIQLGNLTRLAHIYFHSQGFQNDFSFLEKLTKNGVMTKKEKRLIGVGLCWQVDKNHLLNIQPLNILSLFFFGVKRMPNVVHCIDII